LARSAYEIARKCVFLPDHAISESLRDYCLTVYDSERYLQQGIHSVDIFEEMAGRCGGQKMRARFRKQVRRHPDSVNGSALDGLPPAGDATDTIKIWHDVIGLALFERDRHAR